ncbi:OPT superfamily oligopeptide transporter [Exidia glandulosa HHB12029]|uniref:OPT superfamily oligopeptide transporter n=1 Tax=Exidia glandulosa HHB12029 TaxID=1314781 RepID=A0A165EQ64_EXIGL|nr:OPT superfamily oligopeptide transporter [Exidia glandulosa HHB12029]
MLGAVISASNVYLGLKTGWTFGASLFGSIFGFAILKPLSTALPARFGGGYFGPKENVCCQSAATAAGSLGLLFTSGFPAAYQLGLLGKDPQADFGRLITFTLCCAYTGIFFTMPLRRLYILKLKLVFPGATAAAYTIRALHVGRNAAATARTKTRTLSAAFLCALAFRVVSEYAPGIMWDWHVGYWFYRAGWKGIIGADNWGWIWEWTPAFLGVGLLVPLNASVSFLGGAVLAWGIIGPALVAAGVAFGSALMPDKYPGVVSYANMVLDDPVNQPSPKYWMIWPGVMLLLCASAAEVGANAGSFIRSIAFILDPLIRKVLRRSPSASGSEKDDFADPVPEHEQTPTWMWLGGLTLSTVVSMIVLRLQFGQSPAITLLAIVFSFVFSLVGAECSGRTAITPVTALGNFAQLIFGGVSKGTGAMPKANQLANGLAGMITLAASEQAADMLGDLKTTHLLSASPRVQLYAQCCGALVSIFLSAAMYLVFVKANPCINDLSYTTCAFPAPDVGAWRAVALAVSQPSLPIPTSAGITALVLGATSVISTVVKYRFAPPSKQYWFPNWNAVGIAFILGPLNTFPMAMFVGSIVAALWQKRRPSSFALYGFALAAGMIAGEGLGGIVNAVLQIAGVAGNAKGTAVGCPMNVYCG